MQAPIVNGRLSRRVLVGGLAGVGASAVGLALLSGAGRPPFAVQPRVARLGLSWSGYQGSSAAQIDAFKTGLRAVGWVEGRNLVIDERLDGDHPARMPELAAELLALKPDVLVGGVVPAQEFVRVTHTVPIVFSGVTDPVGIGLVASYARPGGNVTGTSRTAGTSYAGKQIEFLRDLVPGLTRVAVAYNPDLASAARDFRDMQTVALSLGIDVVAVAIASTEELEPALEAALARKPHALLNSTVIPDHLRPIFAFATQHGLPSAGGDVVAGCLMNYIPDLPALWHRAGSYHVDRILRGAKPADLPVEGPTVFHLFVNRTTTRALGLAIPPDLAAQVTEWVD